jgi:hypothetical protein
VNAVPYGPKIALNCTSGIPKGLAGLVEAFIAAGVRYVGVVGPEASLTENLIDDYVVGDGSDDARYILTAYHQGKSLQEALEFARSLTGEYEGEVQLSSGRVRDSVPSSNVGVRAAQLHR